MKSNKWLATLLLSWLPLSGSASDTQLTHEEGVALAKRLVCLACHQVDKKRVGPSFEEVSQKYGNSEEAVANLTETIRDGSRGRWGVITMPAQRHVSEEDARRLGTWILNLDP